MLSIVEVIPGPIAGLSPILESLVEPPPLVVDEDRWHLDVPANTGRLVDSVAAHPAAVLHESPAGRPVECTARDRDCYGRIVAMCRVAGADVIPWMLEAGVGGRVS